MNTSPRVTIGFVPRERFSLAATALEWIYKNTTIPFKLVLVDCAIPKKYREQMDAVLQDKSNFEYIEVDHYIYPNQAKNLILQKLDTDYVCMIENDCLAYPGWLKRMVDTADEFPAKAITPMLLEGPPGSGKFHHDPGIGEIKTWEEDGKTVRRFQPNKNVQDYTNFKEPIVVPAMETHIGFFHSSVFETIPDFYDEKLTTREPINVTLALHNSGIPIVLEPRAKVNFVPPPPVYKDELPFYRMMWDMKTAVETNEYLVKKWNLRDMPMSTNFVRGQYFRTSWLKWNLYQPIAKWPHLKAKVKQLVGKK